MSVLITLENVGTNAREKRLKGNTQDMKVKIER